MTATTEDWDTYDPKCILNEQERETVILLQRKIDKIGLTIEEIIGNTPQYRERQNKVTEIQQSINEIGRVAVARVYGLQKYHQVKIELENDWRGGKGVPIQVQDIELLMVVSGKDVKHPNLTIRGNKVNKDGWLSNSRERLEFSWFDKYKLSRRKLDGTWVRVRRTVCA